MKVTGWTYWEDERYDEIPNDEYDMARSVVVHSLWEFGFKFDGTYHTNGDYGVPVIDNKWKFTVSHRVWGGLMADAYPEICDGDGMDYVSWAWIAPEPMILPPFGEKTEKTEAHDKGNEKWVWVTGYKGLDKDMKAYGGFQYEMDKLYIMPDGEPVKACRGGYHLCLNLEDLYTYKNIEKGNRYFECSALVRESDLKKYGGTESAGLWYDKNDKLAAKSIRLIRELSVDEILAHLDEAKEWPEDVKKIAIAENVTAARKEMKVVTMLDMGYAEALARYILDDRNSADGYKLALALDAQPGISMDTKINAIFSHI